MTDRELLEKAAKAAGIEFGAKLSVEAFAGLFGPGVHPKVWITERIDRQQVGKTVFRRA